MPKNIPSLKPKELIRILERGGCSFHREGRGDHRLYMRFYQNQKRIVPIDVGANELSPAYVEISEKVLPDIIPPFLRKQESSIFKAFLDSRFRGSDAKGGFSEISCPSYPQTIRLYRVRN